MLSYYCINYHYCRNFATSTTVELASWLSWGFVRFSQILVTTISAILVNAAIRTNDCSYRWQHWGGLFALVVEFCINASVLAIGICKGKIRVMNPKERKEKTLTVLFLQSFLIYTHNFTVSMKWRTTITHLRLKESFDWTPSTFVYIIQQRGKSAGGCGSVSSSPFPFFTISTVPNPHDWCISKWQCINQTPALKKFQKEPSQYVVISSNYFAELRYRKRKTYLDCQQWIELQPIRPPGLRLCSYKEDQSNWNSPFEGHSFRFRTRQHRSYSRGDELGDFQWWRLQCLAK